MKHMQNWKPRIAERYAALISAEPPFFLNPDYTIEDMAAGLGTNRSYASKYVNEELGISFPRLLNKLRIAHMIRLHHESPEIPIYKLAIMCGFKGAYSFRRAFYKEYNMKPMEYFKK